jgi:ABC-type lipoprotein export system ATPase subunit
MKRQVALLSVDSVSKSYRERQESLNVLSKVSFGLEPHNFCTLCGPSGSGKTTLLNIIGGLDRPDEGQILFEDERIDSLDEPSKCKLRAGSIGIIFQNPNLVSHLTALENVMLPTLFAENMSDYDARKEHAISLLRDLDLKDKMMNVPSKLSEGEKRRISIARALVTHPKLILADEPTINLDSKNREIVLDLLRRSTETGAATIVATHDEEIARLSDLVLRIKFGMIATKSADQSAP